jgi:hypothetical protein
MKSPPVDLTPEIRSEEESFNDGSFTRASLI